MSFSFSSLVRLLVLTALGSSIVAVGLSRLDPPSPSRRTVRSVRYSNINEFFLTNAIDRTPVWLDHETGKMAGFPLEDGDILETASCSPWVDEKNQYQVVGRWSSRTNDGPMSMSRDFGIARYTFPGGKMLDHVSTDIIPVGPTCWFPGTQARVAFTAGNGQLYQYAFEPEPWVVAANPEAGRDLKPRPITWQCPKPGLGKVFLSDLNWPEDPRLGGCLIMSLREQVNGPYTPGSFAKNTLWWLKLNYAGTEIVEVGRLLINDQNDSAHHLYDHRNPTIGTLADGRLALAYLRQRWGQVGWEARVTPIEIDKEHHTPKALESESALLASKCQPAPPCFSSDGRFLNIITNSEANSGQATRLALTEAIAKPK